MLAPQRNSTQLIEPRSLALAMGDIGGVVPPLPVGDECQHCRGVECTPGQDAAQQYLHLGDGQARGFFSPEATLTKCNHENFDE
jgi:hypothetical protein